MADDMGYSDLGCFGSEIETPHIDRLAADGLRFTQFYNTSRCCPTRASLLTGLYPHQAGMGYMTFDRKRPGYTGQLNHECVTIAEALKGAGYKTGMTGKWHLTLNYAPSDPKDNWPVQRGFDSFYGTVRGSASYFDPMTLTRQNTPLSPFADPEYKPDTFYYTNAITHHAVRFIEESSSEDHSNPFFLYVSYTAPHWPMHALEEDIERYAGQYDGGYRPIREARYRRMKELGIIPMHWALSPQEGSWTGDPEYNRWEARLMETYAAMIYRMDQGVGEIVESLRRNDRLENTLILYLQDNGGCAEGIGRKEKANWKIPNPQPMAAEQLQASWIPPMQTRDGRAVRGGPGTLAGAEDTYIAYGPHWANVSNTPFREYKHWVHEGGISTPLIAHWPKGIDRKLNSSFVRSPGHLVDIMATLMDIASAAYPSEFHGNAIQPMEGVSFKPAFQGQAIPERPIFFEHESNRAIRLGKWKLVAKENQAWELYDMENDRSEMNDLSAGNSDMVLTLASQWQAWAERSRVLPLGSWKENQAKP